MTAPGTAATPLLLVAHGSRDARSARAIASLARALAAARPGLPVEHCFLDLSWPRVPDTVAALASQGHGELVAVPLLLTEAYHSRVDVPRALASATAALPQLRVRRADVLGPDRRLLDGLARRLRVRPCPSGPTGGPADGWDDSATEPVDGLVLAGAGTSDGQAVRTVRRVARRLGRRYGVPAEVGFASTRPGVVDAVRRLRDAGARRIGLASYFLAPGLLWDRVAAAAYEAEVAAVAEPLIRTTDVVPELVDLVLHRYGSALPVPEGAAA